MVSLLHLSSTLVRKTTLLDACSSKKPLATCSSELSRFAQSEVADVFLFRNAHPQHDMRICLRTKRGAIGQLDAHSACSEQLKHVLGGPCAIVRLWAVS